MTETQQTVVVGDIHPDVPMAINSKHATIAVYGHEHVAKRDIELLALVINSVADDAGVRTLVYRNDGFPKEQMANCCPDTFSIAINLRQILASAIETCIDKPDRSIFGQFYMELLFAYFHEIAHLSPRVSTEIREAFEQESADDEEMWANTWAKEQLIALAKASNIEPPHVNEIPGLAQDILTFIGFADEDKEDPWVVKQVHMLENRIFYHLEASDPDAEGDQYPELKVHNLKGYIGLAMGQDIDDPEWNTQINDTPSLAEAVKDAIAEAEPASAAPLATSGNGNALFGADLAPLDSTPDMEFELVDVIDEEVVLPQTMASANPSAAATPAAAGQNLFVNKPFTNQVPVTRAPMEQPQTAPVDVYPNSGLTPQQIEQACIQVYYKIYNHIFGSCQWQLQSDIGFLRPEAVAEIPIQLDEMEMRVVVKCDCLDQQGRFCGQMPTSNGQLRGYIARATKLPMFKLYINDGGQEVCRLLMPQNPAKRQGQGGPYTKTALQARGGSAIMYIIEGNDALAAQTGKKYICKIVDGNLVAC